MNDMMNGICRCRKPALLAAAVMLIAALGCMIAGSSASDAEVSEEFDASDMDWSGAASAEAEPQGPYWTYAITLKYSPADGNYLDGTVVSYNFGDGRAVTLTGDDVKNVAYKHVFPVDAGPKKYTVIQMAYFLKAGESGGSEIDPSTVSYAKYTVDIRGFPSVTYVYGHGIEDRTAVQTNYGLAPEVPAMPELSGFTFMGWYTDSALSKAADLTAPVTEPITLYAKYSEDSSPENVTVTVLGTDGGVLGTYELKVGSKLSQADVAKDLAKDGKVFAGLYTDKDLKDKFDFGTEISADTALYAKYTDLKDPDEHGWAAIGLFIAGIIALLSFAFIRHPAVIIAGIAMIAAAALIHFGIVTW